MPFLRLTFALIIAILVMASVAKAQESVAIRDIEVKGTERVEEGTVRTYLELEPGDNYTPEAANKALRRLFDTGLFADVALTYSQGTVKVQVVENPIINRVAFEGNKRITDETLAAEVRLRARSIFTKSAVQQDVDRILSVYQKSGRFLAQVTPKVIRQPQNRVDLVFEINEGDKTEIERIFFVGNKAYSGSKLRETIQTQESAWWRFLSGSDTYDPDRLQFDKELLRRFYVKRGFADFKVVSVFTELTPKKDAFFITYTLEEGDRYRFGDMNVRSQLSAVEGETLENLIQSPSGDTFNAEQVDGTVEAITEHLGTLGYAFVDIDPAYSRDPEADIIDIDYVIKEGPRVYVENIDIKGNVRTLDEVIRREFRLAEGDPYNAQKLKRSKQRIENLGFFKNVLIETNRGTAPDKIDIDVKVEEQSTGELTLGAGFSTADGALADASVTERNLLGKGQTLRVGATLAARRTEGVVSFTEPYFLDREISAGFDVFRQQRDRRSESSFDSDSAGVTLRGGYAVTEHLTHNLRYSLRSDDITNIDVDASRFIKDQEGETVTSLVGHSLIYDKRDSKFNPSDGYFVRFNQDVAGLGGDAKHFMNELRTGYYVPVFEKDWVLGLSAKGGYIFGFDDNVRINNRFFVGGTDLRGFEPDGIGPRDRDTRDALGGNIYYTGGAELRFPLGLPDELGLGGAVFTDFGSLWEVDDDGPEVEDDSSPRVTAGFGLSWGSPLGPIRIDIAFPIVKNDLDETQMFHFNFGTQF